MEGRSLKDFAVENSVKMETLESEIIATIDECIVVKDGSHVVCYGSTASKPARRRAGGAAAEGTQTKKDEKWKAKAGPRKRSKQQKKSSKRR